jgi:hypothetical protein
LLGACRLGNYGSSDRNKMESLLETVASRFFKLDHAKNVQKSRVMRGVSDHEIILILKSPQAYYDAKKEGYKILADTES